MRKTHIRNAFTIIELAASLVALTMLAALITPVLATVRQRGKDTACFQNLARISQASTVYASRDENENPIPVTIKASDADIDASSRIKYARLAWGGKSGSGREVGNFYFWGTALGVGPARRPLNDILYRDALPDFTPPPLGEYEGGDILARWGSDTQLDLAVYRCPADTGYSGIHYTNWRESKLSSFDHYGNSYAAPVLFTTTGGNCFSNSPYFHRLSNIPNPSETIWYMENAGLFAYSADPPSTCGSASEGTVHGWHGRPWVFNTTFIDGHVDPIYIRGFQSPRIGRYPQVPEGSDPYYWYRCVILRGAGWQIDTLPLPQAETDIPCNAPIGRAEEFPENSRPIPILEEDIL